MAEPPSHHHLPTFLQAHDLDVQARFQHLARATQQQQPQAAGTHAMTAGVAPALITPTLLSLRGGSYYIEDGEREAFFDLYARSVCNRWRPRDYHLTEPQRRYEACGSALVLDFDFKYSAREPLTAPLLRGAALRELVDLVVHALHVMVIGPAAQPFLVSCATFAKSRLVHSESVVKEGLHVMFTCSLSCAHQRLFRSWVLDRYRPQLDRWAELHALPLVRDAEGRADWDSIYDEAVASGEAPWMLWKSCKPGRERYRLQELVRLSFPARDAEDPDYVAREGLTGGLTVADIEDRPELVRQFMPQFSVRHRHPAPPVLRAPFQRAAEKLWREYEARGHSFRLVAQDAEDVIARQSGIDQVVARMSGGAGAGAAGGPDTLARALEQDASSEDRQYLKVLSREVHQTALQLPYTQHHGLMYLRSLWARLVGAPPPTPAEVAEAGLRERLDRFWEPAFFAAPAALSSAAVAARPRAAAPRSRFLRDDDDEVEDSELEQEEEGTAEAAAEEAALAAAAARADWPQPCPARDEAQAARTRAQVEEALANLGVRVRAHFRHVTDLVMLLPPKYYNAGSHNRRIRVCWALRDMHPLFIALWLFHVLRRHSAAGGDAQYFFEMNYLRVGTEWLEAWRGQERAQGHLGKGSLIYWARDARAADEAGATQRFRGAMMEARINLACDRAALEQFNASSRAKPGADRTPGITDASMAQYCALFYEGMIKTDSIDPRTRAPRLIFHFTAQGLWRPFHHLTADLQLSKTEIIQARAAQYQQTVKELQTRVLQMVDAESAAGLQRRLLRASFHMRYLERMCEYLQSTVCLHHMMPIFTHLFYDEDVKSRFNANVDLFAFANGVLDMSARDARGARRCVFRPLVPEDLVSFSCGHFFLGACLSAEEWDDAVARRRTLPELLRAREARGAALPGLAADPRGRDFAARWAMLDDFLAKNFPEPENLAYYDRVFAAMLNGDHVEHQYFHFIYGIGRNGKSTFYNMFLKTVFGEYFGLLPAECWITPYDPRKGNPLMRQLCGKRCVVTGEPKKTDVLNEQAMKTFVGCTDEMLVRDLFDNEYYRFIPQCLCFFVSNYRNKVGATDLGTYRRIRNDEIKTRYYDIYKISGLDDKYQFPCRRVTAEEMTIMAQVMLVRMVDGFLAHGGVIPTMEEAPQSIRDLTAKHRAANDPIGGYVDRRLEFMTEEAIHESVETGLHLSKGELRQDFLLWMADNQGLEKFDAGRRVPELFEVIEQRLGIPEYCRPDGWRGVRLST